MVNDAAIPSGLSRGLQINFWEVSVWNWELLTASQAGFRLPHPCAV
ncbi:hypothetical protein QE417_001326 [Mucilaginibacter terrae]|uniref:Uncharacterized protein n=1 Tax=Mucilaginibacter terrae TaxID=1955052 RepID=A0ABU3GR49_9SPHI|nr:hypothetical protein [Mucilaginibacter terrae]